MRLRPRVLADVSTIDTTVTLFGETLRFPLLLAPTAYHRLVHPEAECATTRGAAAAGIPYCISTATTTPLDEIAQASPNTVRWLQVYISPDRGITRDLVHAAESTGVRALCLTVDTPISGTRNREQRVKFALPADCVTPYFRHVAVVDGGPAVPFVPITWRDLEWLQKQTRLPILLKGVLAGDDAKRAVEAGAAGVVVSNHGARNIDTVPATIDALPEVVEAVAARVPVLIDGGIRRGTDILKALALGATATMIGRPFVYGLALGGAAGVTHVVNTLRTEFEHALTLTGRRAAADLDLTVLWE
jgi:4-hydroxymandelate oxidase